MENQCQHLTTTQHNELLKLLQKSEEFFDGTLGTWKPYPVHFELKEDTNPICLQPYPEPKYTNIALKEVELLVLL